MTVIPGVWAGHLCLFLQMQKKKYELGADPFRGVVEIWVGPVSVILESNLVSRGHVACVHCVGSAPLPCCILPFSSIVTTPLVDWTHRNQVGTNLEPNGTSLCIEELGDGFLFVFVGFGVFGCCLTPVLGTWCFERYLWVWAEDVLLWRSRRTFLEAWELFWSSLRSLRTFECHCVFLCTTLLRRRVAELSNLYGLAQVRAVKKKCCAASCVFTFMYTDACHEPTESEWQCGLKAAFFSIAFDKDQMELLGAAGKKTIIFEAELLAIVVAFSAWVTLHLCNVVALLCWQQFCAWCGYFWVWP